MMAQVVSPAVMPVGTTQRSLFLGGGITNCPDWQAELSGKLAHKLSGIIVNPRRLEFDVTDANISTQQIEWEFIHLEQCTDIVFWFPKETLCPITLYELGSHLRANRARITIGCHPDYGRVHDVTVQSRLVAEMYRRPAPIIHASIDAVAADIIGNWLR